MTTNSCVENPKIAVIHQLLASATNDSSVAMCRWTNGLITLTLEEVREIPLEEVCQALGIGDELLTMVVLTIDKHLGGVIILAFDEANGRQLAAELLGRPVNDSPQWTELEKSALMETGNILGCAYMNALSRLIGQELMPSAPYFIQDYGASVLQQALITQAMTSDKALVCRTAFHRHGVNLNWHVLFVPNEAFRTAMESVMPWEPQPAQAAAANQK